MSNENLQMCCVLCSQTPRMNDGTKMQNSLKVNESGLVDSSVQVHHDIYSSDENFGCD